MLPESPRLRVSQAIGLVNGIFQDLRLVVEGEVSSYNVSQGKFVFFDLKDETEPARLSCFMMLHQLSTPIEDGMRVVVTARPTIFSKSGKFSLTIQHVEPDGEGSVKRAFELLKTKLETEGLFSADRKRLLPRYPQHIGIVSSRDAAGYGDFMRIVESALKGIRFSFINVAVQGMNAEREICTAIDQLNGTIKPEVIVLLRGGGSMEDLHAFNSEPVARAIARSRAPILVGVGHERDVTIADYCADVRAATPSNAAQILLPTVEEVESRVLRLITSGRRITERCITSYREHVSTQSRRIYEQLSYLITESQRHITRTLEATSRSLKATIQLHHAKVESVLRVIIATSPQSILSRGYSVTTDDSGKTLTNTAVVRSGDVIHTRLSDGVLSSTVQ